MVIIDVIFVVHKMTEMKVNHRHIRDELNKAITARSWKAIMRIRDRLTLFVLAEDMENKGRKDEIKTTIKRTSAKQKVAREKLEDLPPSRRRGNTKAV